jgi:hypothetical protein
VEEEEKEPQKVLWNYYQHHRLIQPLDRDFLVISVLVKRVWPGLWATVQLGTNGYLSTHLPVQFIKRVKIISVSAIFALRQKW